MKNRKDLRIQVGMTGQDAIAAIAGFNMGSLAACCALVENGEKVMPGVYDGGDYIIMLDMLGLYEERLWLFFHDVCKENFGDLIALIVACTQLGKLAEEALNHAIDNRGAGIDVAATVAIVRAAHPEFNYEEVAV